MSKWFADLNPQQKEAVETIEGPLLVLSGAGSGKTLVITRRIAYLMEQGIAPEHILAVTFTNKAAAEMRERLRAMVGHTAKKVTLSTFHSLGLQMLRAERNRGKNKKPFVIFDQADQMACLRELSRTVRLDRSLDLGSLLARIGGFKNAFLDPEQVPASEDEYQHAAATLYGAYCQAMEAYAAFDFDDLICTPTRMMERSAPCRRRWSGRFRYVLVDEYQDTNSAQLRMLKALVSLHSNLCAVGDDDQSIYGWRGAEVRNILKFDSDFPAGKVIYLMRNYRSVGSVLALANAVIAKNENRHPKSMVAHRAEGSAVKMVVNEDGESEAEWVAKRMAHYREEKKYRLSQIAVLYRSNRLARALESALRAQNITYRVVGGQSYFDRKEVKDLIAYLKLCVHPADSLSLRRVINWPARGIGPVTLARLAEWAEQRQMPLYSALPKADQILGSSDRARKAVAGFVALMDKTRKRLSTHAAVPEAVRDLIDDIGMKADIFNAASSGKVAERRWASVQDFLDGLGRHCQGPGSATLATYLSKIALNELEKDQEQDSGEQVTLSTLHGAKGLEFPLVFLLGVEEGFLPHERVMNPASNDAGGGDLSEERRLCYVGITRAKDELVMTRAAQRMIHGQMRDRAPSRFLTDLPKELFETEDHTIVLSPEESKKRLEEIRKMLSR